MILRLILGDQLNENHSWFKQVDDNNIYVLMEMRQETDYVKHHIQKVVAFFSAMRAFEKRIKSKGHRTHYIKLDSTDNRQTIEANLKSLIKQYKISQFQYQLPDEYRLDQHLIEFCKSLNINTEVFDTEHFMSSRTDLSVFYEGKKQYVMEFFYRNMRKKFDLLVENNQPFGGQWNFDKNNRNKWKGSPEIPKAYLPKNENLGAIKQMIEEVGIKTLGKFNENHFLFPSNRPEALEQLNYFCKNLLIHFGDYQDAMHEKEINLFHSRISFALNVKLISPLEVVQVAIEFYKQNQDSIELSQIEGFVRQIIGWREYIRGIYWKEMPSYASKNVLNNTNPLPDFYWTGKTKMNCLSHSINNSLENAHAHHIQRLMITGNFALLAQIHPQKLDQWYLGIYADAIEWVQLPNTRGMSQWADGGIVATKPYISAAAYINKMSTYCSGCGYDRKIRTGENACPFNSLYWNFLDDKKEQFAKNNRMAMMLRLLEKIPVEELTAIKQRAASIIQNPDEY